MEQVSLIEFCGEDIAAGICDRINIQEQIKSLQKERGQLEVELKVSFNVELSVTDILVAAIAGVVCGAMNGIFKSTVPEQGKFKHEHGTTRTAIDYKVPRPEGYKGSVQGLHRQIGPGHDLGRFKEAFDLISGKKKDFPLWGKNICDYTEDMLHPGNMNLLGFIEKGGFNIPANPKLELMNHLLIDFFTKTSLPLPFSTYIADYSPLMGKLMISMYDEGLNLKNLTGNLSSMAILRLITHSYAYLFKATNNMDFYQKLLKVTSYNELKFLVDELNLQNTEYKKSREFNVFQSIAHGSSFLVDSVITLSAKNYAGLLALDYGTLICFAMDVIKYIKKGTADYNSVLSKIADTNKNIAEIEDLWYDNFRTDVLRIAQKENFYETFNPELIINNHRDTINKLNKGQVSRHNILAELDGWDI